MIVTAEKWHIWATISLPTTDFRQKKNQNKKQKTP